MRLVLVEDDSTIRFTVRDALEDHGYAVSEFGDGAAGLHAIETEPFDILLTDVRLPNVDGLTLFRRARELRPGAGVVVMTAYGNMDDAVTVMREGARDYVVKPFDMDELILRMARVRDDVASRRRLETGGPSATPAGLEIKGHSQAIRVLLERVEAAAASEAPVLIVGEMGTGKDLCARTIHARSRRWSTPLVVASCGAMAEKQFALELFGTERDSSGRRRAGRLENANGGTLYLEDVGELSPANQARLLRVMETSTIEPLGSGHLINVNVRFLAGSKVDLSADVARGRFRSDLLYRLNVLDLAVPPLRERREDIPLLVGHFLAQIAERDGRSAPAVHPAAMAVLTTWDYPGNLHELVHALERAVALARGNVVGIEHLPAEMLAASRRAVPPEETTGDLPPLGEATAQFEREYIQRTLEKVGGHRTRAAALLGISRKSLWQRLRESAGNEPDEE